MTREETIKVMAILKVAYPHYYSDKSTEELSQAVTLWWDMLAEYSYTLVSNAVKALIAASPYPPAISDVREKIRLISAQPEEDMTEGQAWAKVRKAVCNSTYNAAEEFAKLPPLIQRAVGGCEVLRAWAATGAGELDTVISSNFQRNYRAKKASDREYQTLPENVKDYIHKVSDQVGKLEEGEKEQSKEMDEPCN